MLRSLFVFVVIFTLCNVAAPPRAEAGCGILRGIGRVLGVQRRQERRAARRAAGGGLFRGGCAACER